MTACIYYKCPYFNVFSEICQDCNFLVMIPSSFCLELFSYHFPIFHNYLPSSKWLGVFLTIV